MLAISIAIAIAVIMVAVWSYNNYVTVWKQPVTTVGNTTFKMDYYVTMLRIFATTPAYDIESYNFPTDVLSEIKERELFRQVAPRYGIEITPGNITDTIIASMPTSLPEEGNLTRERREELYYEFIDRLKISDDEYRDIIKSDLLRQKLGKYVEEQYVPEETKHAHLFTVQLDTEDEARDALNLILEGNNTLANIGNITMINAANETRTYYTRDLGWLPPGISEYDDFAFSANIGNLTTIDSTLIELSDVNETMAIDDAYRPKLVNDAFISWLDSEKARYNSLEGEQYRDYIEREDMDWAVNKALEELQRAIERQ